VIYGVRFFKL